MISMALPLFANKRMTFETNCFSSRYNSWKQTFLFLNIFMQHYYVSRFSVQRFYCSFTRALCNQSNYSQSAGALHFFKCKTITLCFSRRKWLPPPLRKLSQGKVDKTQPTALERPPSLKKAGSVKGIKVSVSLSIL